MDRLCPILIIIIDPTNVSPLPLKFMEYKVDINDFIASVELRQEYSNPFDKTIEATYIFPRSEQSVFTDFEAIVDGVNLKGVIKDKKDA